MQLPVPLRDALRPLQSALLDAGAAHFSGTLRVIGEPGGDIRFVDGRVVAVTTSGAPGVDALDRHAGDPPLDARSLRTTATVDSAFAIAAGWVERCHRIAPGPDADAEEPGYAATWLLDEIVRRLTTFSHSGFSPHRNLLVRTVTDDGDGITADILSLADGTNTCRDLAFRLGRPLYPITVEVARLLATGRLGVHHTEDPSQPGPLPLRRRGASGINDTLRPRPPQPARPLRTTPDEHWSPLRHSGDKIT
ncbi:hypothetical protein ACFXK0_09755 [Nocardia sp. NPDC059177]|uniref:hypothetical protein n=1 Tax=Nocardia sp. NPDC059177 TaxID=3346759 RepID=UPI0036C17392